MKNNVLALVFREQFSIAVNLLKFGVQNLKCFIVQKQKRLQQQHQLA